MIDLMLLYKTTSFLITPTYFLCVCVYSTEDDFLLVKALWKVLSGMACIKQQLSDCLPATFHTTAINLKHTKNIKIDL